MVNIEINGEEGKVYHIKRKGLLHRLFKEARNPFNAACAIIFCIAAAVVLIFMVNSFFKRIYYPHRIYINDKGAIVDRTYSKEVYLWLFNSSDRFSDSGIRVKRGDRLKMSASGAFHSDLAGLVNSAKDNEIPEYPWEPQYNQKRKGIGEEKKDIEKKKKNTVVYHPYLHNEKYGTVLAGIFPDSFVKPTHKDAKKEIDTTKLHPLYKFKNGRRSPDSGTLHFIVNDDKNEENSYNDNIGETLVVVERKVSIPDLWILISAVSAMIIFGTAPCLHYRMIALFNRRRRYSTASHV